MFAFLPSFRDVLRELRARIAPMRRRQARLQPSRLRARLQLHRPLQQLQ